MTKESFKRKLKKVIDNNSSLLSKTHIEISPGLVALLASTLEKFKKVIGPDYIDGVKFIYVGDVGKRALKIFAEYPEKLPEARYSAAEFILNEACDISSNLCKKCGTKLTSSETYKSSPTCLAHEDFDGYFKNELTSFKSKQSVDLQVSKGLTVLTKNQNIKSETTVVNEMTKSSLKIFEHIDVKNLKSNTAQSSADGDVKKRNNMIFDNLLKKSEYLPYGEIPRENSNIFKTLLEDFPNFSETIGVIENAVALARIGDGFVKIPNILLLGDPGIGKTFFANKVAELLNVDYVEIRMENEQNGSALSGSSEFWSNTKTGEIFNILTNGKTANPLVLVDEVDKANGDSRFDPLGGLYSLLEHETAQRFEDQSVKGLKLNAASINWLFTANSIERVPAPIRSRMIIHEIKNPNFEQSMSIVKKIYKILKKENKWGSYFNETLSDDVAELLANYEPRKMKAIMLTAFGSASKAKKRVLSINDIPVLQKLMSNKIGFV